MLYKMPGDEWQRFANLRLIYTYLFTHPGKKLLFMGCEFGQGEEWNSAAALDWWLLDFPNHQGVRKLVQDLNNLYLGYPVLYTYDFDWEGFEWIDCHDAQNSILVYLRRAGDDFLIVALNFTPVPREDYRIGVPAAGIYKEILNSDASDYWGSGMGNGHRILETEDMPWMDRDQSLAVTLPPLAGIVLKLETPAVTAEADEISDEEETDPTATGEDADQGSDDVDGET
jgi:1,4-alpha-glucan branching enzyme